LEKIGEELRGADDLPSANATNALAGAACLQQLDSAHVCMRCDGPLLFSESCLVFWHALMIGGTLMPIY
jgi:hypothetical protein